MEYTVRLSDFEGPLDLLLYLIRKNEFDIYDIPIADVVRQYVEYLSGLEQLSLDKAGEYLLMLATIMRIKSRMLLPGGEGLEDEDGGEDPRAELVQKLLEYQKFREIASDLEERESDRSLLYGRGALFSLEEEVPEEMQELDIEIDTLIAAFRQAMLKFEARETFVIRRIEFTVEEKMEFIMSRLSEEESIDLEEMFALSRSKMELIILFLALLELMRLRRLRVRQRGTFGNLIVIRSPDHIEEQQSSSEETGQ
jgi:segregation and condensation protein A